MSTTSSKRPRTAILKGNGVSEPKTAERGPPSHQQIFSWTMTSDATADCLIIDVHEMKESNKGPDYFWLGRVPCRSVKVVGMVVGVTVYESRIIYTVDDGTGVIECNHKVSVPNSKKMLVEHTTSSATAQPPEPPKAIADVGNFMYVVGRVIVKHRERQLVVSELGRCLSANDELFHCKRVRSLHQENYSLDEPFVIPEFKTIENPITPRRPPPKPTYNVTFEVPASSPVASIASSPVKLDAGPCPQSPHKLRHPSRLRSRDLSQNTFRIYVKHFMDNDLPLPPASIHITDIDNDPFTSSTPQRAKRIRTDEEAITPRQTKTKTLSTSRILNSRPPIGPISLPVPDTSSNNVSLQEASNVRPEIQGYTISYLRRVPELSFLAKRVLRQERRSGYRKLLEKQTARGRKSQPQPSSSRRKEVDLKPSNEEVKRLFNLAIGQLYGEGSIVIWTGPVRSCSETRTGETSRLWKANSSSSSSIFSSANTTASSSMYGHSNSSTSLSLDDDDDDDDDAELSEPDENEEAYVSTKPSLLADRIAEIIPEVKAGIQRRLKAAGKKTDGYCGASVEQVLRYLKSDDQWRYLRSDTVKEALELLEGEDRVWTPLKGQWDLTL